MIPEKNIYMAGPDISEEDIAIVNDALKNGWYGKDAYKYCELFQDEFAKYHDRKFGIMTPNCTTALHLLLSGLGIGPGDEVIVPECTWIGSTAGIKWTGAETVFCDIDESSWCLSPTSVRSKITPNTKAILTVNLYGNMSDIDQLQQIADENGIFLIEDAAESLGSVYRGKKSGKFGIGSTLSFHRTKTMTTGEGGMLLLDDEDLYDRCMFLRDHGRSRTIPYYVEEVAFKYMPFNVQAALGYAQFLRLHELVERKREQFAFYKNSLSDIDGLIFNEEPNHVFNSCWITALVLDKSLEIKTFDFMKMLERVGVPSRPFFYPLSSLPAYDQREQHECLNTVAYDVSNRGINLPGAANLTREQMEFVAEGIRRVLEK